MSVAIQTRRQITAEELAAPGIPEKFVELIDGELIEMTPARQWHNEVALNIVFLFRQFCRQHRELKAGGDNEGFLISRSPDTVLSPDACLFRRRTDTGATWMEFAPEIAVEVLSPSNSKMEMAIKKRRYFEAGSEQFWLVDPDARKMEFHHRDGRVIVVTGEEVIEG